MTSSSSKTALYLTSKIKFMLENKDLYKNHSANHWYDEINFNITEVAEEVIKNFPDARIIQYYENGFKFKWNNIYIKVNNYEEYN